MFWINLNSKTDTSYRMWWWNIPLAELQNRMNMETYPMQLSIAIDLTGTAYP